MPVGLPVIGTLKYNGVLFDAAAKITVAISFPKDESGRTIIYHRHDFTVRFTVAPGNATSDSAMQSIRAALGEPARAFQFTGCGFGNDLNIPAGSDVAGGPFPEVLNWSPVGSNYAAEVEWRCVVCVPVCGSQNLYGRSGLLALNFEQDFSIDEHGDTTRVTAGYLQIAQNRNGRKMKDTADSYFNRIIVAQPVGFTRQQNRHLSKDKARLDFVIIDRQIPSPNPYPPNVTFIGGRHRVKWSRGNGGAITLRNTISMEIHPKAGISGSQAWQIFGEIVSQRMKIARDKGNPVLLDDLELEEDLFGRPCAFSAGYRTLGCLCDILSATGLWVPIGTNWASWHESMTQVFNPKGTAQLGHLEQQDLIVDFCGGDPTLAIDQPSTNIAQPSPKYAKLSNASEHIPDDGGYLHYSQAVVPSRHRPVTRQSIMQPPDNPLSPIQYMNEAGPALYPNNPGEPDIIQQGGTSRYSVALVGSAVRAKHKIPRPTLIRAGSSSVKDNPPVEVSNTFKQVAVANWFCVPIYRAEWRIEYMTAGSPGRVDPKENLKECLDANGNPEN